MPWESASVTKLESAANKRETPSAALPAPANSAAHTRRRFFQFNLRTLLLLMAAIAMPLGWTMHKVHRQRSAVTLLRELGCQVHYDDGQKLPAPQWLKESLGEDFLANVTRVETSGSPGPLTPLGLDALGELTHLQCLSLQGSDVTDAGLAQLRRLTSLEELDLGWTKMTGAGLGELEQMARLQSLSLYNTPVTDAALVYLPKLGSLERIDLSWTDVGDAGLAELAHLPHLRSLILYRTYVTDAGLSRLEKFAALEELDLSWTKVTDAGLARLAPLGGLQSLSLYGTGITDAGLVHLRALHGLQSLHLNEVVTDTGVQTLQKALPNCQIDQ